MDSRTRAPVAPAVAVAVAIALALAASVGACGDAGTRIDSGGAGTVAPPAASGAPTATGATASTDAAPSSLPPGCRAAPATTMAGMPGGGEIICETPPGAGDEDGRPSPGSPGSGETLFPSTTVAELEPTATEGVLRLSVIGTPCPASRPNDPCPAVAEIVAGTVLVESIGAGPTASSVVFPIGAGDPIDAANPASRLVAPGRYRITVTPTVPDRVCPPADAMVRAGEITDTGITCTAP